MLASLFVSTNGEAFFLQNLCMSYIFCTFAGKLYDYLRRPYLGKDE